MSETEAGNKLKVTSAAAPTLFALKYIVSKALEKGFAVSVAVVKRAGKLEHELHYSHWDTRHQCTFKGDPSKKEKHE